MHKDGTYALSILKKRSGRPFLLLPLFLRL